MLVKSFEGDLGRFKKTLEPELVQSSTHHLYTKTPLEVHDIRLTEP
jgi:hypothetical protein